MDQNELKAKAYSAIEQARGFRRWLALFADKHPNTTAGYIIGTFPFAIYGVVKFCLSLGGW